MLSRTSPTEISALAKLLANEIRKSPDGTIPNSYLGFDGFRLTEEPRRRTKVLFAGALDAWGEAHLKLGPKVEWLFHESDKIVLNLNCPILSKVPASKQVRQIEANQFFDFCETIIPEKMTFIINGNALGPYAAATVSYVKASGASVAFASDMVRLEQGLFLKCEDAGSRVKAQRDLASIRTGGERVAPVTMEDRMLLAQGLGNFTACKESESCGMLAQLEFAQYSDWEIERVKWEPLKHSSSHGKRFVSVD